MTVKKINESAIVASSKLLHKCSTKGKCLNFSNTIIATPFLLTKKPNLPKVHPSAARPSLLLRPAAFRPLLTEGLALSGKNTLYNFNITYCLNFQCKNIYNFDK